MTLRTRYDRISNSYTITDGQHSLVGISPTEYRQFIAEVREGMHNASALFHEAKIRHLQTQVQR
jgi:hypothetical protein